MTEAKDDGALLSRALDQLETLLSQVPADRLEDETPCRDWTVRDLVDHVVQAPARFALMVRGEEVDWSAPTPHHDDWLTAYRGHADELRAAWSAAQGDAAKPGVPADWQCAELAVHTWDLATAIGQPVDSLDTELADRGLVFMRAGLTSDNRAPAFDPEQPAPEGAGSYERIAAFAGRRL